MKVQDILRRWLDSQPPEKHPIRQRPDLPLEAQLELLREQVAVLHDQVWWLSLPWYRRLWWRGLGYRAPIIDFYENRTWP